MANYTVLFLVTAPLVILMACGRADDRTSSQLRREVDDRSFGSNLTLVDITDKVNQLVNKRINEARMRVNPQQKEWTPKMGERVATELWRAVSMRRKGTGIGFNCGSHRFEINPLTAFEVDLEQSLKTQMHEINRMSFRESRYGKNPIGLLRASVPAFLIPASAEYAIAPVVKIGDVLLGTDKFSHFLDTGYWYYDAQKRNVLHNYHERRDFGRFMEGDDTLPKSERSRYYRLFFGFHPACALMGCFGFYGSRMSGVISFADINANEDGFQLYQELVRHPADYVFDIRSIPYAQWNERNVPSRLIPGLITGE